MAWRAGAIVMALVCAAGYLGHRIETAWLALAVMASLGLVAGLSAYAYAAMWEKALAELSRIMQRGLRWQNPQMVPGRLPERMPTQLLPLLEQWQETQSAISRVFASQRDFTANAAHELKTPLAAMRIAGENALQSEPQSEAMADTIGFLLEETARLNDLIERMLLLASAESGRIPVECDTLKINTLLRELLEHLLPLAAHHGQQLCLESSEDASVWADPKLLRMALENCITNAILHNPAGTRIRICVNRREQGGLEITLVDDGKGIPRPDLDRLFDRFFRASAASRGHGLGLPIAKWAVDAFGGHIHCASDSGQGSTFTVLCPETEWDSFADPFSEDQTPATPMVPDSVWIASAEPAQVLAALKSGRRGLSDAEVATRRQQTGSNAIKEAHLPALPWHLWHVLRTPFNGILAVCALLSLLLQEYTPAAIMSLMIVLSMCLRLWQERRSFKAIKALDESVAVMVEVARADHPGRNNIDVEDLVPGDIVHLSPGDMVPADIRLLSASRLTVTEVSTDGKLTAVSKSSGSLDPAELLAMDGLPIRFANHVYAGTHVLSGSAMGVVLATGRNTVVGKTGARKMSARTVSAFEHGVRGVSVLLLSFMAALIPLVFVLNGAVKGNWTESLLFALAVAVGLTPELLPMMVNVNLAKAARQLAAKGLVVKSFSAVHNLGALEVLCVTDAKRLKQLAGLESIGVRVVHLQADDKASVLETLLASGTKVGILTEALEDIAAVTEASFSVVPAVAPPLMRESADAVLQHDSPELLMDAVTAARTAHGNMSKYLFITASSNFGNALSVLLASVLLPFLPMRAVQLLTQNLLYDISQFFMPWDRVDTTVKCSPQNWSPAALRRFMLIFGSLSSVFDLLSFAVLWFVIGARTLEQQAVFQTGWFLVGTVTQLSILHILRTGRIPFLQSRATAPLSVATVALLAIAICLPLSGLAAAFGFVPLPWTYLLWLLTVVSSYAVCAQFAKQWYIRKFGTWI